MTNETLVRAAKGARILEAVDNYGRAGIDRLPITQPGSDDQFSYRTDSDFWRRVFAAQPALGSTVNFRNPIVGISEWVARVPGLFWTDSARKLRAAGKKYVESRSGRSITLRPFGKSELVSGGIGTVKLPPSEDGYHLVTLTTTANASAGVPALVAPEVWDHHRLREGSAVRVHNATWQAMASRWATQFPSTRGIPRAYVQINDPGDLHCLDDIWGGPGAIEYHPFTIMRYYAGSKELYDFVFATAYSSDPDGRSDIEQFFREYKDVNGRQGEYLFDADVTLPMWTAQYHSPAELRMAEALLRRRIEDAMMGENTTDYLLDVLTRMDGGLLGRISVEIDIAVATWRGHDHDAREAAKFLERVPRERIPALIDAIRSVDPDALVA